MSRRKRYLAQQREQDMADRLYTGRRAYWTPCRVPTREEREAIKGRVLYYVGPDGRPLSEQPE